MICGKSVWLWLHRCCRWHGKEARRIAARWQKRRWTAGLLWKSSGRCALRRKGIIRSWSGRSRCMKRRLCMNWPPRRTAGSGRWMQRLAAGLPCCWGQAVRRRIAPSILLRGLFCAGNPERGSVGPALHQPSGSPGTGTPDFVGKLCVRSGEAR